MQNPPVFSLRQFAIDKSLARSENDGFEARGVTAAELQAAGRSSIPHNIYTSRVQTGFREEFQCASPFTQGIVSILRDSYPVPCEGSMFRAFFSEQNARSIAYAIRRDTGYDPAPQDLIDTMVRVYTMDPPHSDPTDPLREVVNAQTVSDYVRRHNTETVVQLRELVRQANRMWDFHERNMNGPSEILDNPENTMVRRGGTPPPTDWMLPPN